MGGRGSKALANLTFRDVTKARGSWALLNECRLTIVQGSYYRWKKVIHGVGIILREEHFAY